MSRVKRRLAFLLVGVLLAGGVFNYVRPIPAVVATASLRMQDTALGTAPTIPWPRPGSAAVGASNLVTGSPLYPPGRLWRLTRINFL